MHDREGLQSDLDGAARRDGRAPFDEEAFIEALVRADGQVDMRLGRWRKSEVREYLESILVAVVVALGAARARRRGVQDPERVDDPDAAGRRPHLRQQVHLRPGHPVHALAGVDAHAARARRRHRLRVPGEPRAGLHQAGDRRARATSSRRGTGTRGSTAGRSPTASSASTRTTRNTTASRLRRSATRAISSSSTWGTGRT